MPRAPPWHDVTAEQIRAYSPTLADRIGVLSSLGLDHVVAELLRSMSSGCKALSPMRITSPSKAERPVIFELYERSIGLLTPMIVEELRDAERRYPAEWITDAFRESVEADKRSWRYVLSVLEQRRVEGGEQGILSIIRGESLAPYHTLSRMVLIDTVCPSVVSYSHD